jgi:hypothetical protein
MKFPFRASGGRLDNIPIRVALPTIIDAVALAHRTMRRESAPAAFDNGTRSGRHAGRPPDVSQAESRLKGQ